MKRNMFNEPRPKGTDEMVEAIDEKGADPSRLEATVEHNDDEGEFSGWTAEVRDLDDGNEIFSTVGYGEDKEGLLADLKAAGIEELNFPEE